MGAQAADRWRQRMAFWHGADLELGTEYSGGGTPDQPDTFRFVAEPAGCGAAGEGATGCVQLQIDWTIAPERLQPLVP